MATRCIFFALVLLSFFISNSCCHKEYFTSSDGILNTRFDSPYATNSPTLFFETIEFKIHCFSLPLPKEFTAHLASVVTLNA